MKELLSTVIAPLIHHPESLVIEEKKRGRQIVLEVHVDPDDMGRVIGKRGRRAHAIRSIMKAKGAIEGKHVVVDIVD